MELTEKRFLGLDIGTTSVKAAVFDGTGRRLGFFTEDYTLDTRAEGKIIEFDAERYFEICEKAIERLLAGCGRIDALSVDTQGETMILCDGEGKPLCPAVVWLDNRAQDEALEIKEKIGNRRVYEITGQPEITAGWPASKLLWFRKNEPEIFAKTKKIFLLEDWILFRLTGNFVTEPCIQSSSVYFDINKMAWWDEMLGFIGVEKEKLPRIVKTGEPVGEYKGIKVISGTLDQIAGTLGCGVTDPSAVSEMTGTIMAICAMTDKVPPFDPSSIIPCHVHALPGKYCRILWSGTAGMALKWFRENFCENYSFKELDGLAKDVPPGCDGMTLLPYFTGSTMPKYNPDAKAVFAGVTLAHTRAHFARAVLESIAFILRQDLEYIGADGVGEIRITGGGASSPLWAQIKADVTGKRLCVPSESETACLGTALLAAVGEGSFSSLEGAASALVGRDREYAPSGADYSEAYSRFVNLDNLLN